MAVNVKGDPEPNEVLVETWPQLSTWLDVGIGGVRSPKQIVGDEGTPRRRHLKASGPRKVCVVDPGHPALDPVSRSVAAR